MLLPQSSLVKKGNDHIFFIPHAFIVNIRPTKFVEIQFKTKIVPLLFQRTAVQQSWSPRKLNHVHTYYVLLLTTTAAAAAIVASFLMSPESALLRRTAGVRHRARIVFLRFEHLAHGLGAFLSFAGLLALLKQYLAIK